MGERRRGAAAAGPGPLETWLRRLHMVQLSPALAAAALLSTLQFIKKRLFFTQISLFDPNWKVFCTDTRFLWVWLRGAREVFFSFYKLCSKFFNLWVFFFELFLTCDLFLLSGNRNRSSWKGGGKTFGFIAILGFFGREKWNFLLCMCVTSTLNKTKHLWRHLHCVSAQEEIGPVISGKDSHMQCTDHFFTLEN